MSEKVADECGKTGAASGAFQLTEKGGNSAKFPSRSCTGGARQRNSFFFFFAGKIYGRRREVTFVVFRRRRRRRRNGWGGKETGT